VTIHVGTIRIEITADATSSRTAEKPVYPRRRASNGRFTSMRAADAQPTAAASGFDVVLVACGDKKIEVIKEVRGCTGIGLFEAKSLVESALIRFRQGVSGEEAERIQAALEKIGATVRLERSHSASGQFHPAYAASFRGEG
jgi:ribosomal protein L7/L12